jgi:hypothetical protein
MNLTRIALADPGALGLETVIELVGLRGWPQRLSGPVREWHEGPTPKPARNLE